MKPREWWIRPEASYNGEFISPRADHHFSVYDEPVVHVIEKSAYDRLEADLQKAIQYLRQGKALFAPNTTNSFVDDLISKYTSVEDKK